MRKLWHKIDPTEQNPEGKDWHQVELHATDAMHALTVDPDHWAAEKPDSAPEPIEAATDAADDGDVE